MEEEKKENGTPKNEGEEMPEISLEEKPEAPEETGVEFSPEELAELKRKAELADNYKIRAEKAEKKLKGAKESSDAPEKSVKSDALSPKDYLALTEAKVSAQDFDEVVRISKILGKPIADALSDKTMRVILAERAEERKTADATQVNRGGRPAPRPKGEEILAKVLQGEVPESDADVDKAVDAYFARRRGNQQK